MASPAGNGFGANPAFARVDGHAMIAGVGVSQSLPHRYRICANMAVGAARMGRDRIDAVPCGQTTLAVQSGLLRGNAGRGEQKSDETPYHTKSTSWKNGNRRIRLPVAAKIALPSAGAAGGTPGSPMPLILSSFSSPRTIICGVWCRRMPSKAW